MTATPIEVSLRLIAGYPHLQVKQRLPFILVFPSLQQPVPKTRVVPFEEQQFWPFRRASTKVLIEQLRQLRKGSVWLDESVGHRPRRSHPPKCRSTGRSLNRGDQRLSRDYKQNLKHSPNHTSIASIHRFLHRLKLKPLESPLDFKTYNGNLQGCGVFQSLWRRASRWLIITFKVTQTHLMKSSLWGAVHQNPFFQELSAPQKEQLLMGCRLVRFEAGMSVIQMSKPTPALFWVLNGTLKVFSIQSDYSASLINIVGQGEVLGEVHFIDGGGHSAEVETIENSTLLRVEARALSEICQEAPFLQRRLEMLIAQRLRLLTERHSWMVRASTGERVVRMLLLFANRYPDPNGGPIALPLRLCQNDLAALIGASRYRVHLCLHELERAGLLRLQALHRITICDTEALADWCRNFYSKSSH